MSLTRPNATLALEATRLKPSLSLSLLSPPLLSVSSLNQEPRILTLLSPFLLALSFLQSTLPLILHLTIKFLPSRRLLNLFLLASLTQLTKPESIMLSLSSHSLMLTSPSTRQSDHLCSASAPLAETAVLLTDSLSTLPLTMNQSLPILLTTVLAKPTTALQHGFVSEVTPSPTVQLPSPST